MTTAVICPWCRGPHAERVCPYSPEEASAVRKARKVKLAQERRATPSKGIDGAPRPAAQPDAHLDAGLRSEMRDAAGGPTGLFATARRRRGPKPGQSRQARYRRRHPEYVAREQLRLK